MVFLLGSIFFFFVLRYILINQLDETLRSEQQEVTKYVAAHDRLPEIVNTTQQWIYYQTTAKPITEAYFKNDTYINEDHEKEPVRQYIFSIKAGNTFYAITINKSQKETEGLLKIIIIATIAMIAIILVINFIINRKVLNRLWNPFYTTIQNIKKYRLSSRQPQQLEDATQKLAKLHQSLLLLTKLENRQFILNEIVNLTDIIKKKINEREDLIKAKKISLHTNMQEAKLSFHQHLAEILVNNLLNNAIRHTPANGEIDIALSNQMLSISNTALNGELDHSKIFQRFYKASDSTDGTGLGLAIVKEICNIANADIQYQYQNNKHQFIIQFGNGNKGR